MNEELAGFKKNLGLDWFQFQTQIRRLVMELIEPTVKRAYDDHELVKTLGSNFDGLKKKNEEYEHMTRKDVNRMIS